MIEIHNVQHAAIAYFYMFCFAINMFSVMLFKTANNKRKFLLYSGLFWIIIGLIINQGMVGVGLAMVFLSRSSDFIKDDVENKQEIGNQEKTMHDTEKTMQNSPKKNINNLIYDGQVLTGLTKLIVHENPRITEDEFIDKIHSEFNSLIKPHILKMYLDEETKHLKEFA